MTEKIGRRSTKDFDLFVCAWMNDAHECSVKLHGRSLPFFGGVEHVAEDGIAKSAKVDANLVGSTGFKSACDKGALVEPVDHFDMGDGGFALHVDGHELAVGFMPCHGCVNGELFSIDFASDDGEITSLGGFLFNLGGKVGVGSVVFGNDHDSGGFFVEAVDDAGTKFAGNA